MSNFDASTPQSETVKNLMGAITPFGLGKVAALLSKAFQYEVFNGATDLAKMDGDAYAGVVQGLSAGLTKVDVSTQQWITVFNPTD